GHTGQALDTEPITGQCSDHAGVTEISDARPPARDPPQSTQPYSGGFPMTATAPQPGQPVVLRNATVLTMDDAHTVLTGAHVLDRRDRIAPVGPTLTAPDGTAEVDASGGIVMPGFIDTHRHMWQTAMRGYGADWTLTQYFVYYYLTWGKKFRPQDYYAGNL